MATSGVQQQDISEGGLAQSVECALCKREAPGSKPGFSSCFFFVVFEAYRLSAQATGCVV